MSRYSAVGEGWGLHHLLRIKLHLHKPEGGHRTAEPGTLDRNPFILGSDAQILWSCHSKAVELICIEGRRVARV